MANNFGKGIRVTSGFDLSAKGPIDNRTVVDTIAQRDAHVSSGRAYAGLKVYVSNEEKEYLYTGGGWIESVGLTDEQTSQLLQAYAHSTTEHASKETLDSLIGKVDGLPTFEYLNEALATKSAEGHAHDDIYFTKTEVNERIASAVTGGKVDLSDYATLDALATKSDIGHLHVITDVADLQSILDSKANTTNVYSKDMLNIKFADINLALASKSVEGHLHEGVYSPLDHKHETDDINGFNTVLENYKSSAITEATSIANEYTEERISEIIGVESGDGVSLAGLANDLSTHMREFDKYKTETNGVLATVSKEGHPHVVTDITDLQDALDSKIDKEEAIASDDNLRTYVNEEIIKAKAHADGIKSAIIGNENDKGITSIEGVVNALVDHENEFNEYKNDTDEILAVVSKEGHGHIITDIADLQSILDSKMDKNEASTNNNGLKTYIDEEIIKAKAHADGIKSAIIGNENDKGITSIEGAVNALIEHENDFDKYKTDTDEILATVSKEGHSHIITDVSNLQEALDSKISKDEANETDENLRAHINEEIIKAKAYTDELISNVIGDINDKGITSIEGVVDALVDHEAEFNEYKINIDLALAGKSPEGHNHDTKYSPLEHKHETGDINGFNTALEDCKSSAIAEATSKANEYTEKKVAEIIDSENGDGFSLTKLANDLSTHINTFNSYKESTDSILALKSDIGHPHVITDIANLQNILDSKIDKDEVNTSNSNLKLYIDEEIIKAKAHADGIKSEIIGEENDKGITSISATVNALIEHENEFNEYKNDINDILAIVSKEGHLHEGIYSPLGHKHEINDINGFDDALEDCKSSAITEAVSSANEYTENRISEIIESENGDGLSLTKLANDLSTHINTFNNYKESTDSTLATVSKEGHSHIVTDITDLQDALDAKLSKDEAATNDSVLRTFISEEITKVQSDVNKKISDIIGEENEKNVDSIKGVVDLFVDHEAEFNKYKNETNDILATVSKEGHDHDTKYSPLGHKHETNDINGFNAALEDCKSNAISEAVSSSNAYTENRVSAILGTETDLNLTKIASDLSAHINTFNNYKETTDSTLATVSKEGHIHVITDITNLQETLDSKINKDEVIENSNDLKSYVDEEIIKAKAHADEKMNEVIGEENEKGIETIKEIVDVFVVHENEFNEFKEETASALASKSPEGHSHEGVYSPVGHKHTTEDITNMTTVLDSYKSSTITEAVNSANTYTENKIFEILGTDTESDLNLTKIANDLSSHIDTFTSYKEATDSTLATVSKEGHTHVISNITGLQDELNSKANTVDVNKDLTNARNEITTEYQAYVSTSISNLVDSAPEAMNTLNELATAIKNNKDIYDAYVESVSKDLALKSDVGHGHVIADTTGLQEALNSKLNKDEAATNDSNLREYVNEEIIGAKKYTDEEIAAVIGEQNDKNIETIKGVVDALIEHENNFDEYKSDIDEALATKSDEGHIHNAVDVMIDMTELNNMLIQIYGFSAQA